MAMTFLERLREDINTYITRDPATGSLWEVVFCAPGFHAIMFYRLSHAVYGMKLRLLARIISTVARFFTGVEIHPGARIGQRFFIDHGMGVVIGETAYIGNDVSIYHGVTLGGVSPLTDEKGAARHPQVGDGVIIGSGAQLLGPIEVGDYARIGSNAVVVNNVEPCATVVGIPARPVRRKPSSESDKAFDPYAVSAEKAPDPMQAKIDALVEEVQALRARVVELEDQNEDIADTAETWDKVTG